MMQFQKQALGLVASSRRKIKPLGYLRTYFSDANMKNTYLQDGKELSTLETVKDIQIIAAECVPQVKKFALAEIQKTTLYRTTKSLYDFLFNHFQYKEDEKGVEQVREPNRSVADAITGIDCDCYSTFASAVLQALNIPHYLRVVELKNKGYYQHIYVVVPTKTNPNLKPYSGNDYIVIDPVMDKFNKEPEEITHYYDTMIKVQRLSGLGNIAETVTVPTRQDLLVVKNELIKNPNYYIQQGYNIPNSIQAIDYLLAHLGTSFQYQAIQSVYDNISKILPGKSLGAVNTDSALNFLTNITGGSGISSTNNSGITSTPGTSNLIMTAGAQAATGNYVGAGLTIISAVKEKFSKFKENRPGDRGGPGGWGSQWKESPGVTFELWGKKVEFTRQWEESATRRGYKLFINGEYIDCGKYIWVENDVLYIQGYLPPWKTDWTAGEIGRRDKNRTGGGMDLMGQGKEPQEKHLSGINKIISVDDPFKVLDPNVAVNSSSNNSTVITSTGNGQIVQTPTPSNFNNPTNNSNGDLINKDAKAKEAGVGLAIGLSIAASGLLMFLANRGKKKETEKPLNGPVQKNIAGKRKATTKPKPKKKHITHTM